MRRPSSGQYCDSSFGSAAICLGIVLAADFQLFYLAHVNRGFQMPGQSGNVTHRSIAGIKQLVRRSVGHMNDRARMKIITLVVENDTTVAALDIDRLFPVEMLARVPTHRDLSPHHTATTGGKTQLGRNHQCRLKVLRRAHPFKILRAREPRRLGHCLFIGFGLFQPIRIKVTHLLIPPKYAFSLIFEKLSDPTVVVKPPSSGTALICSPMANLLPISLRAAHIHETSRPIANRLVWRSHCPDGHPHDDLHIAPTPPPSAEKLQLDQDEIVTRLSEAIQFKTISFESGTESNTDPFRDFHAFLAKSFPRVHAQLTREVVNDYSLLYTWKGKDDRLKPILLMAHIDVVPVDPDSEKLWTHAPFSGKVADGYVWGRGTMDDKVSVLGILEAVEKLLADGFQPQCTVYLAFGHDEEIGGQQGAAKIAALLSQRNVQPEFVLDEGSAITDGIIPGVAAPVAMIGIGEKGDLSLQLTVTSPGGHSSLPPSESAIGILSRAIDKVETHALSQARQRRG